MATDRGGRLIRNDNSEVPVFAVVGLDGGSITGASGPTTAGSYKQITGLSTPKTLADGGAIPADALVATVQVTGQSVRWRSDGTNPTSTVGMTLAVGASLKLYGAEIAAIRFIETAASAVLDVYFSK